MTARDVQHTLIFDRYRRSFVLPNYTPAKWFECDVFEITGAGYFVEYEIKMSISDFKADAKKAKNKWHQPDPTKWDWKLSKDKTKHSQLKEGATNGPCRFWFVLPFKLADNEVPDWAGIIGIEPSSGFNPIALNVVRPAPKLHSEKVDDAVFDHARGVCYYRLHNLRFDHYHEKQRERIRKSLTPAEQ